MFTQLIQCRCSFFYISIIQSCNFSKNSIELERCTRRRIIVRFKSKPTLELCEKDVNRPRDHNFVHLPLRKWGSYESPPAGDAAKSHQLAKEAGLDKTIDPLIKISFMMVPRLPNSSPLLLRRNPVPGPHLI